MALFIDFNEFVVRPEFHSVVYPRMRSYLMSDIKDLIRREIRSVKDDIRREIPTMINTELNLNLRGKVYDVVFNAPDIQTKINYVKEQTKHEIDVETKRIVQNIISDENYQYVNKAFLDEIERNADMKINSTERKYTETVEKLTREKDRLKTELQILKDRADTTQSVANKNMFFTACVAVGGFIYAMTR